MSDDKNLYKRYSLKAKLLEKLVNSFQLKPGRRIASQFKYLTTQTVQQRKKLKNA